MITDVDGGSVMSIAASAGQILGPTIGCSSLQESCFFLQSKVTGTSRHSRRDLTRFNNDLRFFLKKYIKIIFLFF
jgi:hypothetical protein